MSIRIAAVFGLLLAAGAAWCQQGTVGLSGYPVVLQADGKARSTITAEARDTRGNPLPDGTQILFEASGGTVSETLVRLQGGIAQTTFRAGATPGTARVRAKVLNLDASGVLDLELVEDSRAVSEAQEYIEITAPEFLEYSTTERALQAVGSDSPVIIRYRDIVIEAMTVQVRIPNYEVKAYDAVLKMGGKIYPLKQLIFSLNRRSGQGIAVMPSESYRVKYSGLLPAVEAIPFEKEMGVEVGSFGIRPLATEFDVRRMTYLDLSTSVSIIEARKAVAYPSREVQFQRANMKVGGLSVQKVPLLAVSVQTASPLVTDQYLNVSNNQLAVNYPYYLDLAPGRSSLLRLRHGALFTNGSGASGGTRLDFEHQWNSGSNSEGRAIVSGLAREDWGVSLRQSFRSGPGSSLALQVDVPARRALYANASWTSYGQGFTAVASGNVVRSIRGPRSGSDTAQMQLEGDPVSLGGIPATFHFGVQANQSRSFLNDDVRTRESIGLTSRVNFRTWQLGGQNSVQAGWSGTRHLAGDAPSPYTSQASITLSTSPAPGFGLSTTYDFLDDGFNSDLIGRHRLSSQGYYRTGPVNLRASLGQTLDKARANASLGADWQIDNLWRIRWDYFWDDFDDAAYVDQTFVLGYRLGFREVGLSYSGRRKRLGLEILGTRF
jgi:hypothetical protein